jgi:hypothetical protein
VSSEPRHPLWKAICGFSLEAVKAVLGDAIDLAIKERGGVKYVVGRDADLGRLVTDAELAAIARASTRRYWTDGRRLYREAIEVDAIPPLRELDAVEALERFGLDALEETSEKGSADA